MYKNLTIAFALTMLLTAGVAAQRNIEQAIDHDPLLEADAKLNLDVAWQAFGPARRAYKQVLLRFEETLAAYPEFSKMDEFLYLAGMSSYYLSRNEGRQKVDLTIARERERYNPEKLREDAEAYLTMMLERNPDSRYRTNAERVLKELKDAHPPGS
ncbi:MAG TPA: outer membrane protein assembly factor BamD [Pyrinomonadaceae bacterium]|nr:outer membrane protein assembly factor BamD [Pyrinomonadaceae bacterium]HMP67022.1 outer membrane protein assembly factor BamD [Pyrinomonadaceae bacterium]